MTWTPASAMRIALLDDHAVVRYGLAMRLAEEPDLDVVGAFATSRELMAALRRVPADLLLIDYALSSQDIDGLNLIRALRVRFPRCKILVTSAHHNPATVALAMKAGAGGFVGKSQDLGELIEAVRTVGRGRQYLNRAMITAMSSMLQSEAQDKPARRSVSTGGDEREAVSPCHVLAETSSLSPREREVLRCCLDGMSVTEIAEKFMRSVKTISGQKQSALRKLGVRTDHELFKIASHIKEI